MAGEDTQELEIKIIPDEDANVEQAVKTEERVEAKKAEAEVEKKDPAVADLASQFEALKESEAAAQRRAEKAEQEASRHRTEADTARKQVASSQLDTVVTALNAAKADAEAAKKDLRVAREAGDIEAEVEASDRLAMARADERRLDEAKSDLEHRAKHPPKREQQQLDPVEAFAQGRTPKTAAWIRAHPEYAQSEKGIRKMIAADAVAQAEDLIPDTPEYFAKVEEYLGITKKVAPIEAPQKRQSAPVAPGSAVSNGGGGSGPVVSLTQREANAAIDGTLVWNYDDPKGKFKKGEPIGHQEMARRKLAMQKQGLYDKNAYEA